MAGVLARGLLLRARAAAAAAAAGPAGACAAPPTRPRPLARALAPALLLEPAWQGPCRAPHGPATLL